MENHKQKYTGWCQNDSNVHGGGATVHQLRPRLHQRAVRRNAEGHHAAGGPIRAVDTILVHHPQVLHVEMEVPRCQTPATAARKQREVPGGGVHAERHDGVVRPRRREHEEAVRGAVDVGVPSRALTAARHAGGQRLNAMHGAEGAAAAAVPLGHHDVARQLAAHENPLA